ncbi:MAG: aspartate kinase [Muribaculaceae bacterium]
MILMKFGGTSVANNEAIRRAISIVEGKLDQRPIVVVSAMSKVTDMLYRIADEAAAQNESQTTQLLEQLRSRHIDVASQLLAESGHYLNEAISEINNICDYLEKVVTSVCALGELSNRSKAIIISRGEILSSTIIYYAMNAMGIVTELIDARDMIITSGDTLNGDPIFSEINARVPGIIEKSYKGVQAVITQGFIASTATGEPSVLGRGGSDYSASLIGMAVDAERIEIWTDVDGVRSADPRRVNNTKCLERISFEEAAEMAHFGAKVLHPLTIEPAINKNIPIYVLNSTNPSHPGTAILRNEVICDGAKAVSWKEQILLINIFSPKMINATGFVQRVFKVFRDCNVSVDLISTSEANISVTVTGTQDVSNVVEQLSQFAEVYVDENKAQLSVIGKNIINHSDVLQRVVEALRGYKLYMISQGASNINVSFVVDREVLTPIVNTIHQKIFES